MRRRLALVVVLLAWAAPAHAARVWSDPEYPTRPAPGGIVADVAPDGTSIEAWPAADEHGYPSGVIVRLDGGPAVRLAGGGTGMVVAAGDRGNAVVAWSGVYGGTDAVFARPDASFGAVQHVADTDVPQAVRMNSAGDAAIVLTESTLVGNANLVTAFRPAGGTFAPPVPVGVGFRDLAISPAGETVIGTYPVTYANGTATFAPTVMSRTRDGTPITTQLADRSGEDLLVAVDGHGRAIATWNGQAAIRVADGTWQPPAPLGMVASNLAADPNGDVLALGRPSYTGPDDVQVVTGSLATRTLAAPVTVDHRPSQVALGMGPDGTAVIVEHDATVLAPETSGVQHRGAVSLPGPTAPQVRVVRRDGLGPFGPPQVAACYPPDDGARNLAVAGVTAAGAATLIVDAALVRDAPGPDPAVDRTCPASVYAPSQAVFSEPPVAGRPFTVTVDVARPGYQPGSYDFVVDNVEVATSDTPTVALSFATPGRHALEVDSLQTSQATGRRFGRRDLYTIDVAAPSSPALTAAGRLRRRTVLRRGVAVSATGVEDAVFELRHGNHRFGRSAGPRIRLNARGRRYVRRHAVAVVRVVLLEDGQVIGRRRVLIRA